MLSDLRKRSIVQLAISQHPGSTEQQLEHLRRDHEALHRVLDDFRREMDDTRATPETRVEAAIA